ncbi:hypothetical protein WI69_02115 [Burkholderia diffusa]|nr:hypothetical protein WI69_02115 [Burkholderia diffusa]
MIAYQVCAGDDILFIDLGAVGTAHEGDAGATFVRGDDPDMHACMRARRRRASFSTKSSTTGAPKLPH